MGPSTGSGKAGARCHDRRQLESCSSRLAATLALIAALLSSCSVGNTDVSPGDVVEVHEEREFFFHEDGDRYAVIPLEDVQTLVSASSWSVPEGMTLDRAGVDVATARVEWSDWQTAYEADGYRLTLTGRLTVAEDAEPGVKVLAVALSDLASASRSADITPRTSHRSDLLSSEDTVELTPFIVHPSWKDKYYARYGEALTIAGTVLVVVLAAVCIWMAFQRPASRWSTLCEHCGVEAESKYATFYQNIGMVVVRFTDGIECRLCKSCVHYFFWRCTGTTFFLGWWGIASVGVTPFILVQNCLRYLLCIGMPAVPEGAPRAEFTDDLVERLAPHTEELVNRLNENQPLDQVAEEISSRAGVAAGQVVLYVRALRTAQESEA